MLANLQFKPLGSRKAKLRAGAREDYLQAKQRRVPLSDAIFHAEMRVRRESYGFIEALLISLAIKFVIALIKWWWENRVEDPGETPLQGEPQ
jgi:hypothetical protein